MTDKNKKKDLAKMQLKKNQIEQILLRPDNYIGSIEISTSTLWVYGTSLLARSSKRRSATSLVSIKYFTKF